MKRHQLYIFLFAALIGIALGGCAMKYDGIDSEPTDTNHLKDSPDEQGDDPTRPTNDPMTLDSLIRHTKTRHVPDTLITHKQPPVQVTSDRAIK
jgi:hypothetical protein